MAGDHPTPSADAVEPDRSERTVASEQSDRWLARGRLILGHWKSWLAAVALGLAAWGLYDIGGWTLDTMTFTLAAALVVAYRLVTLASDFRAL